ncbi:ABC transporter ATP-binding protein [Oceanirhabdus seepicola]|uniref:ABC transporter ATP-binding protein n=1 Tax=Oceanirhabdus seepicola TaxID=2828781 RepID=A0A9J6P6D6_9CLOT|nr:ABC transporter ATP-binding protein [Oceanirhabdus seepicola]
MLQVKGLRVNYGAVEAVKGIDIQIKKNNIVSILGANGAGKTSTLHAISGLVKKTSGKIIFDGQDITDSSVEEIVRLGIIQCPEGRRVFPKFTVEENLRIGAYSRKGQNIKKELQTVYELFPRLFERKKQIAGTLSGGEQQMLAIGRGLMATPKLFILDEPSLGLAPKIVEEIFETIKTIRDEGVTILLVEQNAMCAMNISDYVYALEVGKVAVQGTASELLQNEQVKNAYLGG